MKRVNNLFDKICSIENINEADRKARKGKSRIKKFIQIHDNDKESQNLLLSQQLRNGTYRTSKYKNSVIYEPKLRIISKLPYYPDRIAQHAIMNVMKPIFISWFIRYTYANIEGRGIHACMKGVANVLKKHKNQTKYCLKLDIKKYYPNINHNILKSILFRKIKDVRLLDALYEIIDSFSNNSSDKYGEGVTGLPLGNYTSGYFANIYLMYFDRWCKQVLKCRYYFRYADDIVILSDNKRFLHSVFYQIQKYLNTILNLKIKNNYQIFNVDINGIDFVGYVLDHDKVRLRKFIKYKIKRVVKLYNNKEITKIRFSKSFPSYYGWIKHGNCRMFLQSLTRSQSELCRFVT